MKLLFVAGTRPELIKLKPIADALDARHPTVEYVLLFMGQHYLRSMSSDILEDCGWGAVSTVSKLNFLELCGFAKRSDAVIVEGDTTTVVLGALAAVHEKTYLVHVEAGLRSNDFSMREERNRMAVDMMADLLCCPTAASCLNVADVKGKVEMTGNTIADVIARSGCLRESPVGGIGGAHCVVTLHRPELVSRRKRKKLCDVLMVIDTFLSNKGMTALLPMHPLFAEVMAADSMPRYKALSLIAPIAPSRMHQLVAQAPYVFTDSGGVQEEACIFGAPCFTFRPNTERPETIELGANVLISPDWSVERMYQKMMTAEFPVSWSHPYGENVGERIASLIIRQIEALEIARCTKEYENQ